MEASEVVAQSDGRCSAMVADWRARQSGEVRCKNAATRSGFCGKHQTLAKSKTRGQSDVLARYRQLGEPRKVSPVAALTTLLEESAGNVEFLRNEVSKLQRLVIAGKKEREEVAKLVVLYNEERDRHERYVLDALRIRLDERQVQLYESQAKAMALVVKAVIDGIGLMGENRQKALSIAAAQMGLYATKKEDEWRGPLLEAQGLAEVRVINGEASES